MACALSYRQCWSAYPVSYGPIHLTALFAVATSFVHGAPPLPLRRPSRARSSAPFRRQAAIRGIGRIAGHSGPTKPASGRWTNGISRWALSTSTARPFSRRRNCSRYFESYLATEVDRSKLVANGRGHHRPAIARPAICCPTRWSLRRMSRPAWCASRSSKAGSATSGCRAQERPAGAIEAIASPLAKGGPLKDGATRAHDRPDPRLPRSYGHRHGADAIGRRRRPLHAEDQGRARPVRAFTYADNRGTGSVGHSRLYNSFAISSVLAGVTNIARPVAMPGDELRVDLFAMPGGHSRYLYGQVSARFPLGASGMRLQVSGSRGDQYLRARRAVSRDCPTMSSAQLSLSVPAQPGADAGRQSFADRLAQCRQPGRQPPASRPPARSAARRRIRQRRRRPAFRASCYVAGARASAA